MLTTTFLRCEQCGHDNDRRYRFCGMCGAKLPPSEPVSLEPISEPRASDASRPVSGPSFLGLAEEPSTSVSYLLEDEVSSSHPGRIMTLLLIIAIGIAAWHWRHTLSALAGKLPIHGDTQVASSSSPAPISASPSEVAPAMGSADNPQANKPSTGVGDTPQTPPASTGTAQKQAPDRPPSGDSGSKSQATPDTNTDASAAAPSAQPSQPTATASSETSAANTSDTTAAKAAPAVSKHQADAAPSDTSTAGDALESEGEKYLYGSGVPANCDRAQKSLLAAANQSNTKADTVLGTMYATGHCASRDLPVAYRWFAKALDQEPGNARYQRDLEVLWQQMSPDERQVATKRQ